MRELEEMDPELSALLSEDESEQEQRALSRYCLRLLGPAAGQSLLSVGGGPGYFLDEALQRGLLVTGMETEPEAAVMNQRQAPGARLVVADCREIPFEAGTFDYIACPWGLEPFASPEEGFREIFRVLKSGGKACLVLAEGESLDSRDEGTIFTLSQCKRLLKQIGFSLKSMQKKKIGPAFVLETPARGWRRFVGELVRRLWPWRTVLASSGFVLLLVKPSSGSAG